MTALLAGYHATYASHREGIERHGLQPAQPATGRPYGVYVFSDDGSFDMPTFSRWGRVEWDAGRGSLIYQAAYFGPVCKDKYVINGMIFLGSPQLVTLVTGNN